MGETKRKRAVQNSTQNSSSTKPIRRECAVIRAGDSAGNLFSVATLIFEKYTKEHFRFQISPLWYVIDALPSNIFTGLSDIESGSRTESYCCYDTLPQFITERTPGESRPDLLALFPVGEMTPEESFRWLLETKGSLGGDNLTVESIAESRVIPFTDSTAIQSESLTPLDTVSLTALKDVATSNVDFRRSMLYILARGATVKLTKEKRNLSKEEHCTMLRLLLLQEGLDKSYRHRQRRIGIDAAKEAGKYTGRKRIPVDGELLERIAQSHAMGEVSTADAMKSLGIPSRSTFYRRLREIRGG